MMATMNTLLLLTVAIAVVVCIFTPSPAAAADGYLCPWRTVAHPDDPFIQSLGDWALEQQHAAIQFIKVERAKAQCVGDIISKTRNYELIIDGNSHADGYRKFKAVVYVINFTQPQKVVSFTRFYESPPPTAN